MARTKPIVLKILDETKISRRLILVLVSAGLGFLSAAYSLLSINFVSRLLGRIYYSNPNSPFPGSPPPNVIAAITAVALCGTLAGQLFFGWLGDKLGRTRAYTFPLVIMLIFSLSSGLSFGRTAKGVMSSLCFFRFWLGFGAGGVYPLSSTIVSETFNKRRRGLFLAVVYIFQGIGTVICGIVTIIVSAGFKNHYKAPTYNADHVGSTVPQADYVWRTILMFGAVPPFIALFLRSKIPETARYTALVKNNPKQATLDMSKFLNLEIREETLNAEEFDRAKTEQWGIFAPQFTRRHGFHLFVTASAWFLFSVAVYSQTLVQKEIFIEAGWLPPPGSMNAIEEVFRIARAQILLALCGTVPGLWITILLIEILGRKTIQIIGFFFMTVFLLGLGIPYNHWISSGNHAGFVIMYVFTYFFANFGPNPITFIVPAEIFPARLRTTCHGIAAACGRVGAIVGSFGFLYAAQGKSQDSRDPGYPSGIGVRDSLCLLAVVSFLGFVVSLFLPETKGKSLEDLSRENLETEDEIENRGARSAKLFCFG